MVIVGMGLRSNSVERFPNKLSYNEIFKMNLSVWRDVRSQNGSRSGIVGLREETGFGGCPLTSTPPSRE